MVSRVFVGFGFGAIQGGLFLPEAAKSGNFDRLAVSEIDRNLVADLKSSGGVYFNNVAGSEEVSHEKIEGVEIYNPMDSEERDKLVGLVAHASELCTALPSYEFYDVGRDSVAKLLADGLLKKNTDPSLPAAVVYAAENDDHAAGKLEKACLRHSRGEHFERVVFSETVIAKMCTVVKERSRIQEEGLRGLTPISKRAILVEEFDEILIEARAPRGFVRGLNRFVEKKNLEPFAAAKFLGHNAIHAMLGYLARDAGISMMHGLKDRPTLIEHGLCAFVEESGVGLRNKFSEMNDPLFSESGFNAYAEDSINRMINPFLRDPVARITRDPMRKLGWNDRMLGAMRLAGKANKKPLLLAKGAHLALKMACAEKNYRCPGQALDTIWKGTVDQELGYFRDLILNAD